MATGLPLTVYTQPPTGVDLRYKVPYLSPFPSCAMDMSTLNLSQWNYYNSLLASAATQNIMASMLRMTSNSTRLSPPSRDSGIYSDPAVSPQGSLDLSMTPNRNKGTSTTDSTNSHLSQYEPSLAYLRNLNIV